MTELRDLPSVDELLRSAHLDGLLDDFGRPLATDALRTALEEARQAFPRTGTLPDDATLLERTADILHAWTAPTLQPVINATGVIIHTNLGRAPLSSAARRAMEQVGAGYATLEYDLAKGKRGSRLVHAEALLQRLTGAEAALVVNNNAAAVLLALTSLARRRRVVIARTQLIEIGGGFRVPDVMKQSGARLVEVGTTNRVHLSDYQAALEEPVALVLRAHRSNFQIIGFTSEPSLGEMATVAHEHGVPLLDDLGSGSLLDTSRFGMAREPMVQDSLEAGADLVCFSGDKLLGGPQAGILVGRKELVTRLKKHPLARAIRADKLCLAALSATLLHYLRDEALTHIPVWRMISTSLESLQDRASRWATDLGHGELLSGESTVGGGSLPGETLPTCLLSLQTPSPNRFLAHLRAAPVPVIARVEDQRVVFDPRTVLPEQDNPLLDSVRAAIATISTKSGGISAS
jgi:L-seryl-tRNA(Ser) seleniumtransferase